jgi:hypothetical protein
MEYYGTFEQGRLAARLLGVICSLFGKSPLFGLDHSNFLLPASWLAALVSSRSGITSLLPIELRGNRSASCQTAAMASGAEQGGSPLISDMGLRPQLTLAAKCDSENNWLSQTEHANARARQV